MGIFSGLSLSVRSIGSLAVLLAASLLMAFLLMLMMPLAMTQCWKVQDGPSLQAGMCSSTRFMLGQWLL